MTIVGLACEEAYDIIDVDLFKQYLLKMKHNGKTNNKNYYAFETDNDLSK
jgi:hypothetical protein